MAGDVARGVGGDRHEAHSGAASSLRPLALKNTEATVVAAAVSRTMRKTATAEAHSSKRGFMARRDLTSNTVEMDAYSRMFEAVEAGILPTLLLDLEAAFPLVSREFALAARRAEGFPAGLVSVFC